MGNACGAGYAIRAVNADGTVTCEADDNTTYTAGAGLTLSGSQFSVNTTLIQARVTGTCTAGSSIRVINSDGTVTCEADDNTTTFWSLSGNSGTDPATQYLGTSDNVAFELRTNGLRTLRLEPNTNGPNVIGGYSLNWLTGGVYGATIFGGGIVQANNYPNRVTDAFGTVSGGVNNQAGNNSGSPGDGAFATVGGGINNIASAYDATVGGGINNTASASYATVGGGGNNLASGSLTFVGGGHWNTASGEDATIGGGYNNTASSTQTFVGGGTDNDAIGYQATVSGGYNNIASGSLTFVGGGYWNTASGARSSIAGGDLNKAGGGGAAIGGGNFNTANGDYAAVPGGYDNEAAGNYSFAAGRRAKAVNTGAFVWADSNEFDFSSVSPNTFRARATNGFKLVTGIDTNGAVTWDCHFFDGGSWACSSDRDMKENFRAADSQAILDLVSRLPVSYWNAKGADPKVSHLGPMAQDFYAAFGLGDDDKSINTIDLDGVALAAIQGLYSLSQEQKTHLAGLQRQNAALVSENAGLKAQLSEIEQRLARLEGGGRVAASPWSYIPYSGFALLGIGLVWLAGKRGGKK